jgi:YHS domain-containing protein
MVPVMVSPVFAAKKASAGVVNVGNKMCPVSGDPVSGKDFVVYKGKRYDLCCPMCKKPFSKDPEKYVAKVNAEKVSAVAPVVSKSETMEKDMEQGSL